MDDGWPRDIPVSRPETTTFVDSARSAITRNQSPDVPFDRSINPYRGCEHGCIYCYARPSHAWIDLSPGLDFETRIGIKPNAPALLRAELARPGYRCAPIAVGVNTDAYQPQERRLRITRSVLEVLLETRHPVLLITKSSAIERDLDLIADLARDDLVRVTVSVTTMDRQLAATMEPRAAAPQRRIETIRRLAGAGIPVGVNVAPVIPVLTDPEIEHILETARAAGAVYAEWLLLRLPLEVRGLFDEWLKIHHPLKADHIWSRIRDVRDGADNDTQFGRRSRGTGDYAAMIAQRFAVAHKRLGFSGLPEPRCDLFRQLDPSGQIPLI